MSNYAFCFESDLNDSPGRITECFLCSVQPEYKIVKWCIFYKWCINSEYFSSNAEAKSRNNHIF